MIALRTFSFALLAACVPLGPMDNGDGPRRDGPQEAGGPDGGMAALYASFTFGGCRTLSLLPGGPRCTGPAPVTLRLVPISTLVEQFRWQVRAIGNDMSDGGADGGMGEMSNNLLSEPERSMRSPALFLPRPGRYQVTLAAGGRGDTAAAAGEILVLPAALGAPCEDDGQCEAGLRCLCGRGATGRDGACPGLSLGVCTRGCEGDPCPTGSQCLDLSRSAEARDGGIEQWRQPLCVPACRTDLDCRPDLLCRELPLLGAEGRRSFGSVCFGGQPAGLGEACADPMGQPDRGACATGLCEELGARALCSAACATATDCGSTTSCAKWNGGAGAPAGARCVPRCDAMRPCADPLLSCQTGTGGGALGFSLPGAPALSTVCAPRRCSAPADCKIGRCVALGGASFCTL